MLNFAIFLRFIIEIIRDDKHYDSGMDVGPTELIIILVIVMLLFGAQRLPKLARSIGQASKEFKDGIKEATSDTDSAATLAEQERKAAKVAEDARIDALVTARMAEREATKGQAASS